MFCSKCGLEIAEGQAFCSHCGTSVTGTKIDENTSQMQQGGGENALPTLWEYKVASSV